MPQRKHLRAYAANWRCCGVRSNAWRPSQAIQNNKYAVQVDVGYAFPNLIMTQVHLGGLDELDQRARLRGRIIKILGRGEGVSNRHVAVYAVVRQLPAA